MSKNDKFVANRNLDFVMTAESIALTIAADPAKFEISQADAEELTTSVGRFRAAFEANQFGGQSKLTQGALRVARKETEETVRRLGTQIRHNQRIDSPTKIAVGIKPR